MKRGLSRSLTDSPLRRSGHIEGPDCTDSQADSPGCPDLQQDGGLHRGGPTTSPAWLSGSRATSSGTASRSPASRARGRWRDRLFTWLLYFRAVHTVLAFEKWSGRRDLNPRPLDPQSSALPSWATSRCATRTDPPNPAGFHTLAQPRGAWGHRRRRADVAAPASRGRASAVLRPRHSPPRSCARGTYPRGPAHGGTHLRCPAHGGTHLRWPASARGGVIRDKPPLNAYADTRGEATASREPATRVNSFYGDPAAQPAAQPPRRKPRRNGVR